MIIICSGPDTFRARTKARELVAAFRDKHDPQGLSYETIEGVEGASVLLSRLASGSLFAAKKMIRADGCLAKMPLADVSALATRLMKDGDQTIVLTVEEEPPVSKILDALKTAPLFHYPFPVQAGAAFKGWVRERAKKVGIPFSVADAIADYAAGDSWLAVQELSKQAADPKNFEGTKDPHAGTVFEVADAVLSRSPGWRSKLDDFQDVNSLGVALSQLRSYIKIQDGMTAGIHPYVVKKMRGMKIADAKKRMSEILYAMIASRTSLGDEEEVEGLI